MKNRITMAMVMLAAAFAALATGPVGAQEVDPSESSVAPGYHFTREDALWASRLCAHEATWAGGEDGTPDCGGIIQAIRNRMNEGESFTHRLSLTSPRFWAGTTSRSWARYLVAGRMRSNPPGWPAEWPNVSNYDERWHSVYRRTVAYMSGREPLPCDAPVTHWFGRETDGDAIRERMESGRWMEATCGGITLEDDPRRSRNAFMLLIPRPTETTTEEEADLGG